ncbi:unnamed protein product [Owenia fusiformis]|uniref:Fibrinogen C-terminal domain-containing protein n=1 Tax=Owenia fusiformis TaxID=6347 RepID=A0A8S4P040_OWEFU|nr:unnamed protein product [Owenia fusiformis]
MELASSAIVLIVIAINVKDVTPASETCRKVDIDSSTTSITNDLSNFKTEITSHLDEIRQEIAEIQSTCANDKEMPKDCTDVPEYTGVKEIQTADGRKFDAYCKRGWLYLSRRFDGSVDFYKTYAEYQSGFGDRNGEYFLGLDNLVSVLKQGRYTLHVDLKMWPPANTEAYAQYSTFHVGDATDGYRLRIGGYTGTAGDSLGNPDFHQNMKFSTKDNDQDTWHRSCAKVYRGAGWYGACHVANLFGKYNQGSECPKFAACMSWFQWPDTISNKGNHYYSFKEADMKLKRQ